MTVSVFIATTSLGRAPTTEASGSRNCSWYENHGSRPCSCPSTRCADSSRRSRSRSRAAKICWASPVVDLEQSRTGSRDGRPGGRRHSRRDARQRRQFAGRGRAQRRRHFFSSTTRCVNSVPSAARATMRTFQLPSPNRRQKEYRRALSERGSAKMVRRPRQNPQTKPLLP